MLLSLQHSVAVTRSQSDHIFWIYVIQNMCSQCVTLKIHVSYSKNMLTLCYLKNTCLFYTLVFHKSYIAYKDLSLSGTQVHKRDIHAHEKRQILLQAEIFVPWHVWTAANKRDMYHPFKIQIYIFEKSKCVVEAPLRNAIPIKYTSLL